MIYCRSRLIFGFDLAEIGFKLVGHGIGLDAGDVAVVLEFNDLAEVARTFLPGQAVGKEQESGIGPLGGDDGADVAEDVRHFRAGGTVAFRLDQDPGGTFRDFSLNTTTISRDSTRL